MNSAPQVKGYCPGALQPMMSGDGLVVRVRPFGGRLTPVQADGLANLSEAHGNGLLDLSSRANVQLRGITEQSYAAVIDGLQGLGLLDATPQIEARRNILIEPFWQPGDEMERFATQLTKALAASDAPDVPHKFGFVIDTGVAPVLRHASGDIRIERDAEGGLLLIADGMETGRPVAPEIAVAEAIALARWFVMQRGDVKRMSGLIVRGDLPSGHDVPRQIQTYVPVPGITSTGAMIGGPFGQLEARTLAMLAKHGTLRMTPWRMLLIEHVAVMPDIDGLITDAADPLLRVVACTGAPACSQGHVATRAVAQQLAVHVPYGQMLHVSGCAKGCAHPKPAAICVTGTPTGLDLIHNGRASDAPLETGLTAQDITKAI